jgi:hypothetical protein
MTTHHKKKHPLKTRRIRFEMPDVEMPKQPQEPIHTKPEFEPTIKNLSFVSNKSGSGHTKKKKKHTTLETMLEEPLPQVETILIPPPSHPTNPIAPSASEETLHKMYPTQYHPPTPDPEPEPLKYGMAFQALMRQGAGFTRKLYH